LFLCGFTCLLLASLSFCRETRRIQSLLFKEVKSLVSRKEGRKVERK
jgi:hypothetical protein